VVPQPTTHDDAHHPAPAKGDQLQLFDERATSETRIVLETLTPREEKVVRMRFGIGEKSDHTLEEIGREFLVTRERIRQIEAKAVKKLRHPQRSKALKDLIST